MNNNNISVAPTNFTSYQILVILILALTQFTVVLDFMVMSPLGDLLIKDMNLTTGQFGFAVSSYAFSAGLSGLLTAGFADRFDRKKLLQFFYIGFIVGTFFCSIVTSYPLLIAARIITGLFGGVIGSISMAIVADLFALQQRGRVMGFLQMGFGASQVLGIPISLYIATKWHWQTPFLSIVGLSVVIWLVILFKLKPINEHLLIKTENNAIKHLLKTVGNKNYRIGFLATALLSFGGFLMMPWGSTFAINNLNVSNAQLPILFMIGGITTLLIMPVIGKLSDKIDKYIIFSIASVWLMVIVIIYTNLSNVSFGIVLLVNALMMIGIMSRMVPSMALVTALPEMKDRGAFMSINSSLQQVAGGIAAAFSGLIVYQKDKFSPLENYNLLGIIVVVVSIICMIMVYRVNRIVKVKV